MVSTEPREQPDMSPCVNEEKIQQGDHSACAKPPVDFKTKVPLWPGQARAAQAKVELLS